MDEKKILIVNLSKGKVGEGNANLLGSLFITKIYLAAMSRADAGPYEVETLPPFYFYVDEFQNFANESFASILSEARKYKLALTVAHQYIEQMTDEVKSAVFGNVGTMITFRVGATDAEVFEKEFAPFFILDDFVNLSAFQIYLRLMIDSQASKPFSAKTLNPIQKPAQTYVQLVIANSRAVYGRPRFVVEEEVAQFYAPVVIEKKEKKVFPVEEKKPTLFQESKPEERKTYSNEKVIKVRKIRDDTPLPPRVLHRKEKGEELNVYERGRAVEEAFHRPPRTEQQPRRSDQKENRDPRRESAPKMIDAPLFEEKKAVSLKDALAKAMSEHQEEEKKRKEVEESVLRKLIEE